MTPKHTTAPGLRNVSVHFMHEAVMCFSWQVFCIHSNVGRMWFSLLSDMQMFISIAKGPHLFLNNACGKEDVRCMGLLNH